jgi:hypothetical protein
MKTVLLKMLPAFLSFMLCTNTFSQDEVLDLGFANIKIDAKIEDLKSYLVAVQPNELKSANAAEIGGYITSGWLLDLKKAGISDFYGLKIMRIEIYFNGYDLPEGTGTEDVYCFHIYTEKTTSEDDLFAFTDKLTNVYGESMIVTSPFGDDLIGMSWFTELTLLGVNFGFNEETGEVLPHFVISFNQAYGG